MEGYIQQLKEKYNAVILAHNYQHPEVQDAADYLDDSLGLALQATKVESDVIVFCGVDFMTETAKILNPDKTVIHPESESRCPMAAMVDVDGLQALKNQHPEAAVVSYVNTTAEVKAASDICCTSSNAVKVIKAYPSRTSYLYQMKTWGDTSSASSPTNTSYCGPVSALHTTKSRRRTS